MNVFWLLNLQHYAWLKRELNSPKGKETIKIHWKNERKDIEAFLGLSRLRECCYGSMYAAENAKEWLHHYCYYIHIILLLSWNIGCNADETDERLSFSLKYSYLNVSNRIISSKFHSVFLASFSCFIWLLRNCFDFSCHSTVVTRFQSEQYSGNYCKSISFTSSIVF